MKETRKVTIIGDRPPADLIEWVAQEVAKRLMEETTNDQHLPDEMESLKKRGQIPGLATSPGVPSR